MQENPARQRRQQQRLRRRQRPRRVHAGTGQGACEAVGVIQQVQHRRDHQRADDAAGQQRHLLPPRRRADQLPGLEVLQVVVGDGRRRQHRGGHEQHAADRQLPSMRVERGRQQMRGIEPQQQQRHQRHRDDGDAGDRARRRADDPGHVAARRRHQETEQGAEQHAGERHAQDRRQRGAAAGRARHQKRGERRQQAGQQHAAQQADHPRRQIAVGLAAIGGDAALRPQRRPQPGTDRPDQPDQRPDRGDRDGPCADEPHLVRPDAGGERGRVDSRRMRRERGQHRHRHPPAQHRAEQHRQPAANSHQIAGAHQRQREAGRQAEDRRARRDRQPGAVAQHPQPAAGQAESRRHQAAGDQRPQPALCLRRVRRAGAQHLRRGGAFRVGQGAAGDQRPPQRDGEQHPQHPARGADRRHRPEREALPVADHQQARQHEDDRRQRAGRRGLGLHHVVLEDAALEPAQRRHRDHRRRDRRGEGQPDLQPQIDVRRREDDRQQRPQQQAAQGQFAGLHPAGSDRSIGPECRLIAELASPPARWSWSGRSAPRRPASPRRWPGTPAAFPDARPPARPAAGRRRSRHTAPRY